METYVRRAERSDIPQILPLLDLLDAIHLEMYPERFRAPLGGGRSSSELVRALVDASQEYWVAVQEGRVLGVALYQHRKQEAHPVMKAESFLMVDMLVVDPAHRGKGIGRLLMDQASKRAREEKYNRLEVKVYEKNQQALKLYESMGYTTTLRTLGIALSDQ